MIPIYTIMPVLETMEMAFNASWNIAL